MHRNLKMNWRLKNQLKLSITKPLTALKTRLGPSSSPSLGLPRPKLCLKPCPLKTFPPTQPQPCPAPVPQAPLIHPVKVSSSENGLGVTILEATGLPTRPQPQAFLGPNLTYPFRGVLRPRPSLQVGLPAIFCMPSPTRPLMKVTRLRPRASTTGPK
jgi:hypothetical protein